MLDVVITTHPVAPVVYRVGMSEPQSHEYEIQMDVPALPGRETVDLVFPAWAPGSYLVRDFVRHVYRLEITDARGRALPATRLDKGRWRIETGGRPFRARYLVFAFEQSVRTSFLDESHAYWNGTSLFFFVEGELQRPCRVVVAPPPRSGWYVDTALPAVRGAQHTFAVADFDELVDSPFEVGTHLRRRFRVGRATFDLALQGRTNADVDRLVDVLRRVVVATGKIFGGKFPFDRYVFIVHALPVGSGGLEHRASVTMDISGLQFEDESGYHKFADLAAHEFFHAWNVKRIRDATLGPFDYTKESYTRLLWLHEGFTDYLANVIILRAGVTREKHFWKWISEDWPKYASRPGRSETPLSELSFEAWIKLYKPAENHVNRAVSYYEKGLWAGMALDLMLRLHTGGARGLPELFRVLWDALDQGARHVSEADVRAAARAVLGPRAKSSAVREIDAFFDRYINGTDELPLPALWRRSGLTVREQAEWEGEDVDAVRAARARAWMGVALHADRTTLRNVVPDSPAWRAGLTFNDELVAIDGARVTATTVGKRVGDRRPGDEVRVAYFRRDELRTATLTLAESPERKLVLKPDPKANGLAKAVLDGWMGV
jgi:predicted metalloprotease with PDZ domain